MRHTHHSDHCTSSALNRFFCAIILVCLVAAGISIGGVSTARAQDSGTATPTENQTPTTVPPNPTVGALLATNTPVQADTLAPTAAVTLPGTSEPTSAATLIPGATAVKPSPTALATLDPTKTITPTIAAPTLSSQALVTPIPNKYFTSLTITALNGVTLGENIINGPPAPPPGTEAERKVVSQSQIQAASAKLLDVPAYDWSFGCSATSGAMIAGYYDRNGYPNMYSGLTNSGTAPTDSSPWPNWTDGTGDTYAQDPLAASHNGLDGRNSRGSIDDYWYSYYVTHADPFINNWSQHAWGDAIGDYMKTSQSNYSNSDGSTSFYYIKSGSQYTCSTMAAQGISQYDGTYGRKLFYEKKGYTVTDCYSQETDNQYTGGFSFAQYQAEINAGRPVMLNLAGHTIVGVGYDANNTVLLHDTWDFSTHTMTWGGSYSGMALQSVSIVNLQAGNAVPSISSLSPAPVTAGSSAITLTVKGTNFMTSSTIYWNDTPLTTTFVNNTQLNGAVPSGDLTTAGEIPVTVINPSPGGGTSSPYLFTIRNPVPSLTSLNPPNVLAGSSDFSLTATGTNFVQGSILRWNGTDLNTTYGSSAQISASIPASRVVSSGTVSVAVFNPAPGGGTTNPALNFTINNPQPVLSSISPNTALAPGSSFTLTVNGSSFVSGSLVHWNGAGLSTTFVNSTQLTANVPSSDLTGAGAIAVTVYSPSPGGGTSAGSQPFTLTNPLPVIGSLSPTTRAAGTQAFTVTVSGSSFGQGAIVRWNGSDLASTYVSSNSLTAAVSAANLTNPGTASLTVFNPAPGGGLSAGSLNFTLTSIDPAYGVTVLTLRPTFDWPAVDNATSYTFQASKTSNLASPFLNKTISLPSYLPTADIPGNSPIYWRVRALVNKVWGAWTETRLFYSPNPPKLLTLKSPANNALTTAYLPTLDWNDASLPAGTTSDHYDLQIATDAAFTTGQIEPNNPWPKTSDYTFTTALSPNTGYYWRVCTYNSLGQSSSWSSVYYLKSAILPPALLLPQDGLDPAQPAARPDFSWNPVAGASSYTFQIAKDSAFRSLVVNAKITGAAYTPTADLLKSTVLYWRVQALGTNGPSLWSQPRSFTSANGPSAPKLSSPAANALLTSSTPTFYWSASTLPAGITLKNYQIQVSTDAAFATTFINDYSSQTSYLVSTPSLLPNTKYYWRVRTYGSNDAYSGWSSVSYFRSAMLQPSLAAMAGGDPVANLRPTFEWGDVDGASSYTIEVAATNTFSPLSLSKTAASSNYIPTSNLPAGHLLYWRVQANGTNGPSLWSNPGSFHTP